MQTDYCLREPRWLTTAALVAPHGAHSMREIISEKISRSSRASLRLVFGFDPLVTFS